jgi:hypothetical protein
MEIRISGKNGPSFISFGAWIKQTKDKRQVLIFKLGELQIAIYPFDKYQLRKLGEKLIELSGG